MIEKLIFSLTALLGFICLFIIGFRYKTNRHVNSYLILFLFLSSFRFFIYSISDVLPLLNFQKILDLIFFIILWPLLYMYFSNLVNDSNKLKIKDLVHIIIIIPFVFFFIIKSNLTKEEFIIGNKILFIAIIVWNIVYAIASYKLLKDKVWNRNSAILLINQQNKIIKQWTQILFSVFVLLLFRFLICLLLIKNDQWYINHNNYMWVSGLIWIGMYIKILYSPDFLYGYEEFQNKIKEYKKHNIVFNNIWIMDASKLVTNVQDTVLKEKIASQIENYILAIEYQAVSTNLFFTKNLQIEDVAHKLTTPKSHLLYIFKYHAAISFADFKKIIRIQKIILLVEEGYLKNNTMESLAAATGFSSYSSFFKSFKSIAGMSPQEYCSKMI